MINYSPFKTFLTIWLQPRKTVRLLVDYQLQNTQNPDFSRYIDRIFEFRRGNRAFKLNSHLVWGIALICFPELFLTLIKKNFFINIPTFSLQFLGYMIMTIFLPIGLIFFLMTLISLPLHLFAKLLNGNAIFMETTNAFLCAFITFLPSLFLCHFSQFVPVWVFSYFYINIYALLFYISLSYGLFTLFICLAEVHKFSLLKAIFACIFMVAMYTIIITALHFHSLA